MTLPELRQCRPAVRPTVSRSKAQKYARLLRALGDPTRLQIISMLVGASAEGGLCVCDIVASFRLQQPTISHHLRVLRHANLVTWRKEGSWVYYSLNRARLAEVRSFTPGW